MSGLPPVETGHQRIPRWIVAIGAAVILLGLASLSFNLEGTNPDLVGPAPSGEPTGGGGDAVSLIEQAACQACHGDDLSGTAAFPSLIGIAAGPKSENLQQLGTDHPDDWANLWIDGTVPEVADIDRLGMPAFGGPEGQLTTEEIATIVDYLLTLE
jgi:mono/diheme cytochrome c family protein